MAVDYQLVFLLIVTHALDFNTFVFVTLYQTLYLVIIENVP